MKARASAIKENTPVLAKTNALGAILIAWREHRHHSGAGRSVMSTDSAVSLWWQWVWRMWNQTSGAENKQAAQIPHTVRRVSELPGYG